MRSLSIAAGAAIALCAAAGMASAAADVVQNGTFQFSGGTNTQFGTGYGGEVTPDWVGATTANAAVNLQQVFTDGTATTAADYAHNQWGDTGDYAYGVGVPGADVGNTFTGFTPNGSNIISMDGDPAYQGGISQTITGLTAGNSYTIEFYWAGGQLENRSGPTTETLAVTWDATQTAGELFAGPDSGYTTTVDGQPGYLDQSPYGSVVPTSQTCPSAGVCFTSQWQNPSGGFSGWNHDSFTFAATSSTEVLSFLAFGTPAGAPPQVFLGGVSGFIVTPEPASWAMMILGVGAVGALARRRRAMTARLA